MFSISRIAVALRNSWRFVRGEYTIQDLVGGYYPFDNMVIKTKEGYFFVVYCQKKQVYQKFHHWFIPNRIMNQYRIFSVASPDSPEILQEACQLELESKGVFPNTTNDWVQKQIVINEYLDLLMQKIEAVVVTA